MRIRLRRIPISAEHGRPPDNQFAWRTIRHVVIVCIDQTKNTACAWYLRQARRCGADGYAPGRGRWQAGFGGAKRVGIRRLQEGCQLRQLVAWHQVSHGTNQLDALWDCAATSGGGNHVLDHSGHHDKPPQRFGFGNMQDAIGIITGDDDDLTAEAEHMDRLVGGNHVKHRCPRNEYIAGSQAEIDTTRIHPGKLCPMADHGTFGIAGRPAGVEYDVPILGFGDDFRFAVAGAPEPLLIVIAKLDVGPETTSSRAATAAKPGETKM